MVDGLVHMADIVARTTIASVEEAAITK